MNEPVSEQSFRVERLPKDEPNVHPVAYIIDGRGVMRRASEAEAWLWDELVKAREQLEQAKAMPYPQRKPKA